MRVVSLLPSATEICYALGHEPVGVSHECDHPPAARDLPAVNRSSVDSTASSEAIDRQVRAADAAGGVYEIRRDRLAALDPDLVVTQGICDVCAVDDVRVRDAVDALDLDCTVLTTDPHTLDDVLADIDRIGRALDRTETAAEVRADVEARIEAVSASIADTDHRPRVVVLDWLRPVMVAGHWVPELVQLAGGRYELAAPGERSRPRQWEAIRAHDPDVLIAAPCGFPLAQTLSNRTDLTTRPGWDELTAVRTDAVYAVDGHHYVNRPGPRLVETLEFLAGILHPDEHDEPPAAAVRRLSARTRPP